MFSQKNKIKFRDNRSRLTGEVKLKSMRFSFDRKESSKTLKKYVLTGRPAGRPGPRQLTA